MCVEGGGPRKKRFSVLLSPFYVLAKLVCVWIQGYMSIAAFVPLSALLVNFRRGNNIIPFAKLPWYMK